MPNIRDQSTCEAIAREFCSNGRNKTEAMRTVGYKDGYCDNRGTGIVYTNSRVIEAIRAIDAKSEAVLEHNRDIAIKELRYSIELYDKIIKQGEENNKLSLAYVQAIKGRNEAIRELNSISNLHSSTINTGTDKPLDLSPEQLKAANEAVSRAQGVKLSREGA